MTPNTVEMRRISHRLVEAWWEVLANNEVDDRDAEAMHTAMDAIIAAYTPGYNAESDPEYPEEYIPGTTEPTADALRDDDEDHPFVGGLTPHRAHLCQTCGRDHGVAK